MRLFKVRAIVSDHVLFLNDNPLTIHLHRGGRNATYYDFVAGDDEKVPVCKVRVEADLPSVAFFSAKRALGEMLDVFTRGNMVLPIVI